MQGLLCSGANYDIERLHQIRMAVTDDHGTAASTPPHTAPFPADEPAGAGPGGSRADRLMGLMLVAGGPFPNLSLVILRSSTS